MHIAPGRMRKACRPARGAEGSGHRPLGGDVAHRARQPLDQEIDERLQVMPVLVGLGVEDDAPVARRKSSEAAVARPVLPHVHDRRPRSRRPSRRTRLLVRGRSLAAEQSDEPVPEHLDGERDGRRHARSRPRRACCRCPGRGRRRRETPIDRQPRGSMRFGGLDERHAVPSSSDSDPEGVGPGRAPARCRAGSSSACRRSSATRWSPADGGCT